MPHTCGEDTGRKDQGQTLLDDYSTPLMPDEDGPTIMDVTAPMANKDNETSRTPSM
jgi:hypothetical protein